MSKATKAKHVVRGVLNDYILPSEEQSIVKVLGGKGNNLHEVETPQGEKYLVSMPTKFRRNVWIKRGDFVIVQPITEGEKVKAEIVHILYADQIKYIKGQDKWPKEFVASPVNPVEASRIEDESNASSKSASSEDDDDLFVNTNRPLCTYHSSENSSDDDEENVRSGATK